MFKIKGLNKLKTDLDRIQTAFSEMNEELSKFKYDPKDPTSIEAAIVETEQMIDDHLGKYPASPTITAVAEQMKDRMRTLIIERAAQARLVDNNESKEE